MVFYYTTKYDFPVTNRVEGVNENNIGWIKGIMSDELPFEAELWKKDGETDVCFLIPSIYLDDGKINPYDTSAKKKAYKERKEQGIIEYVTEEQMWDEGVLSIGMVFEFDEVDPFVIQNYVEILENNELIEYISDLYNADVQYVTDINGNEFARIMITLEDSNGKYAKCPLFFEEFEANKKVTKLKLFKK